MLLRVLCVSVFLSHCIAALKFSGVTDHVRLGGARGRVVGFADLNADKATDILFQSGGNLSVYLWSRGKEKFHLHHLITRDEVTHTSAVDLDGDGQVDLLTLSREGEGERGSCHSMAVHWMRPQAGGPVQDHQEVVSEQVLSPPLVLDANGDHVPDLLTHSCANDTATLWISTGILREFRTHSFNIPLTPSHTYHVDLTDDNLADVVIEGWDQSGRSLVFLKKDPSCTQEQLKSSLLSPSLPVPLPHPLSSLPVASPFSFTDIDGDGETEMVGLTCPDLECNTLQAHILSLKSSSSASVSSCAVSGTQPVNFTHVHTVAIPGVNISPSSLSSAAPVLGDVDLDGFLDLIVPASSSSGVLLLVARQCHDNCNGSKVTLDPQWVSIAPGNNITSVFFFDLWEDGVLDLLVSVETDSQEQLLALRHRLHDDHAFLKILVLSGHCYHNCNSGQLPYGSVLPGAVVRFSTKDRMGRRKEGVRTLTSGHAHNLPFTIFGLGQTPSLVERLEVGVEGGGEGVSRQWTNLVPNSQIIVIPSPPSQPLRWRLELYLTPGDLVYSTAAVLTALFLATGIIVLLLHTREKLQDTREKRMAKHKFHFNAM